MFHVKQGSMAVKFPTMQANKAIRLIERLSKLERSGVDITVHVHPFDVGHALGSWELRNDNN